MITPMKRLQTNFRTLKSLLTDFEHFTLNKSASKSIPYPFDPKCKLTGDNKHCTKGVKNDFLLIFNKIDEDISIGFVVNYPNLGVVIMLYLLIFIVGLFIGRITKKPKVKIKYKYLEKGTVYNGA
jgi:hypothetical protein